MGDDAMFGDRRFVIDGGLGNGKVGALAMGGNSCPEVLRVELAEESFLIRRGAGVMRCVGGLLRLLAFLLDSIGTGTGDSTVSKKSSYSFHTSSSCDGAIVLSPAAATTKLIVPELLEPDRPELCRCGKTRNSAPR